MPRKRDSAGGGYGPSRSKLNHVRVRADITRMSYLEIFDEGDLDWVEPEDVAADLADPVVDDAADVSVEPAA